MSFPPETKTKIVGSICIALVSSFLIFFISLYLYHIHAQNQSAKDIDIYDTEKKFYSQNFKGRKIFILGSSEVRPLNTTYIHDFLEKNGQNYTIYNLAINADDPSERLQTIDMIANAKPDVVVYGIADRDFIYSNPQDDSFIYQKNIGPDFHFIFSNMANRISNYSKFDFGFLMSPETYVSSIVQDWGQNLGILKKNQPLQVNPFPNMPFAQMSSSDFQISNATDNLFLEGHFSYAIDPYYKNKNYIALEKIIDQLKSHEVHVIIFVVPSERYYNDNMPPSYKNAFIEILNDLSNRYDMTVYSLWYKYADLPIWHDTQHIAIQNPGVEMYSHDVAQIILHEIGH